MIQPEQFETFLGAGGIKFAEQGGSQPDRRLIAHIRNPEGTDYCAYAGLKQEIALLDTARRNAPLFVCYYTENTPYEALADTLRASLDRFGMPHRVEPVASRGSWVANTGLKADFIERIWQESDRPICWVDADAEILRPPSFVQDNPFDIALVRRHGWYDMSGFVYFAKTPAAGQLIAEWASLCRANPHVWDQVLLTLAWYRTAQKTAISTQWLNDGIFRFPRPFIRDLRDRLFYYPSQRKIRPFIDQKQASRSLKSFVNASKKSEDELGSDDLAEGFKSALKRNSFDFPADAQSIFAAPAEAARA